MRRRRSGVLQRARAPGIAAFGDMLRSFPIDDPLDEEILETLNQVRGKFKTVVALPGCITSTTTPSAANRR